jgi:hypothetical protein
MSKVKSNSILRSTLVNIDSSFRNRYPKNIIKTDTKVLPTNPITLSENSNYLSFNYPNHGLESGDSIIIQNVEGISKILSGSFYLINNFNYVLINFGDNFINMNYKNVVSELKITIDIFGEQIESNFINDCNIPFNYLIGPKTILILNDIPKNNHIYIEPVAKAIFGSFDEEQINKNCLFFELPYNFINKTDTFYNLAQSFKISYNHVGGIGLGFINSNYPINNYNYQSSQQVYSITDANNFVIYLNYQSYGNYQVGGSNVQVAKIINSLVGYPDADNYIINLKKSFNNVVNIELVSTEFPYIDVIVKTGINDKLYWRNIDDGNHIYQVSIDEGFYTALTLLDKITENINKVERIISTSTNKIYNNFEINLESGIQKISFKPFNLSNLPNSLSIVKTSINQEDYYVLSVIHPKNIVEVGDMITIADAVAITMEEIIDNTEIIFSIDPTYINKEHIVYNVNLENESYDIILGKTTEINRETASFSARGGEDIKVKSKSKASFHFNYPDTIGEILGFKNVGDDFSITDFKSEITNQDMYANSNNLDAVGNEINYTSGFFNMSGKYNYFLMYLNDIEYIFSNNNLSSAFAKILLSGNPGDILFNTFVSLSGNIYSKNFPISTLTELNISFVYPNGSRLNFRNIDHSFTLRITEEIVQNENTYLNSQNISVADEMSKAILNQSL